MSYTSEIQKVQNIRELVTAKMVHDHAIIENAQDVNRLPYDYLLLFTLVADHEEVMRK